MRFLLALPAAVAALLSFATVGVVHRLSNLDDASAADFDRIVAGEVHALYAQAETWQGAVEAVALPHCWTMTLRPEVWLFMAVLLGGLFALARRLPRPRPVLFAWLCIAVAALPWTVCWWMVRQVGDASEVGPWLARMLGGLLLGCAASLGVVLHTVVRPARESAALAPAHGA